ncbi:MAG TPA: GNAT family N-acetyltransferase [Gemmatimonadaceae bacterium]|jgi:GNAT superfamily N-acetyltransferase|nr:GNAT family N-acetyltransferase [Gemmatimonadaceae bacterium]
MERHATLVQREVDAVRLRVATMSDVRSLNTLIAASARELSAGFYSAAQVEALITHVFGVDTQLIADGTYYLIDRLEGEPVATGGWSFRRTLYGGDQAKSGEDTLLNPARDAARIRAFFVHPQFARRGLGRQLYAECERSACAAGFRRLELMATLPGEPLYSALGFRAMERSTVRLPGEVDVPLVRMEKGI